MEPFECTLKHLLPTYIFLKLFMLSAIALLNQRDRQMIHLANKMQLADYRTNQTMGNGEAINYHTQAQQHHVRNGIQK